MPLPDDEERLLAQIEQDLRATDPKFAVRMTAGPSRFTTGWRTLMGLLALAAGFVLVLLAAISRHTWLALIGFAAMVAAGAYLLSRPGHRET